LKIDLLREELKKEEAVILSDEGDLDAFKLTLDPSYPNLEQELESFQQVIAAFKFEVTYSNVKIIKGSDGEAKVYYMAHVHKISGPEFPDMNVDSVDTVKKNKDGEWKITNSVDLTIEYL
jgi:hypothetical protein